MPKEYPPKPCEYCKKDFVPNRSDKRFCKETCQKLFSGKKTGSYQRRRKERNTLRLLRGYQGHKKNFCECCGFIAVHKCQLDVDHIDGNHDNNHPDNLQTLCSNCHRLKTWLNRDWEAK